jgi:hypothetical protein
MFYFKDAPLAPSCIDPEQLARVQRFRGALGAEGGLYWRFLTLEEFERLSRLHLARQIQEFVGAAPTLPMASRLSETLPAVSEEDEIGLLDLLDLVDGISQRSVRSANG